MLGSLEAMPAGVRDLQARPRLRVTRVAICWRFTREWDRSHSAVCRPQRGARFMWRNMPLGATSRKRWHHRSAKWSIPAPLGSSGPEGHSLTTAAR